MTIEVIDPTFRRAIDLIDDGDADGLRQMLEADLQLLNDVVPVADNTAGDYFANPKLLWFVAENPVRNDALPPNIVAVTETLIGVARAQDAAGLQDDLNYTLALVASGRVAREAGVQNALIETLTQAGANTDGAVLAALGHREAAAGTCLLSCGATMTLQLASGLGRTDDVERLAASSDETARQEALTLAATNGHAPAVEILLRHGADPTRFNPDHLHRHTTPLHQAVDAGSLETVKALVDGGADVICRDKSVHADALGWAQHFGHADIVAYLQNR